ncbi:MAG TPA: zinc ribbon domain-containing protein [Anaerolineae bacterium]|nr:zinc ribbon domain-containing protein [Anaerolineae bacterium]HMR63992.1 zinc ribbon domain-containing protein [Anaerolineae bacterium]
MALYEYYCPDCNTKFEAIRSMKQADEAIVCKHCESRRPTRVLSLFAAHTGRAEMSTGSGPSTSGAGGCCGGACGCRH